SIDQAELALAVDTLDRIAFLARQRGGNSRDEVMNAPASRLEGRGTLHIRDHHLDAPGSKVVHGFRIGSLTNHPADRLSALAQQRQISRPARPLAPATRIMIPPTRPLPPRMPPERLPSGCAA